MRAPQLPSFRRLRANTPEPNNYPRKLARGGGKSRPQGCRTSLSPLMHHSLKSRHLSYLVMIDVIFADHQELFRIGAAEILAAAGDIRILAQPQSPEQLLSALETLTPQVLVLSTNFLPAFSKIEAVLKRSQTTLLVLAEENDHFAYVTWLRARGVIRRSMDGPILAEAIRRVARGELFVQGRTPDMTINPSVVA